MYLDEELNELLVDTFRVILENEEQNLKQFGSRDLSVSEFHLLEAIAKEESSASTVGGLAVTMGLAAPSVTVAVKKLERKGYVEKIKSPEDGRNVFIALTERGSRANRCHQKFHSLMIQNITEQMAEEEKRLLCGAIRKLNKFFKKAMGGA